MRQLLLLLITFSLTSLSFAQETAFDTIGESDYTHVIVISIDGARPDAIQMIDAPHLQSLAETGAVDWESQTIHPSVTVPAHTSLLTGLNIMQHGVFHNEYRDEKINLPSFITIAAENGIPSAMIVGKEKLHQLHTREDVFYEFATRGDGSVVGIAIERLQAGDQLLFVHLPNPDFFGHGHGWMTDFYLSELEITDFHVGRIIEALDELGIRETTLIVVTSDHGGMGYGHGSLAPEDMTIPLIFNGAGIPAGTILENTEITQVAPTILSLLGFDYPDRMDEIIELTAETEQ